MAVMTLRLVLHCFMAYRSMSVSGLVAKARVRTSPATDTRLGVVEDCGDGRETMRNLYPAGAPFCG